MRPSLDKVGDHHESVWNYPRPAIAQPTSARIIIEHSGTVIATTLRAVRTIETSHPPSYYIPPADIAIDLLHPAEGASFCEWKGVARYWDVFVGGVHLPRVGWSYPSPTSDFEILRDYIAFYAGPFDRCSVDGISAKPQDGGFYGGWITPELGGPFKGSPDSMDW